MLHCNTGICVSLVFCCLLVPVELNAQYESVNYLKNAWIVDLITVNDTIAPATDCTIFFHAAGKYGMYCREINEIDLAGDWSIKSNQLIVNRKSESIIFQIIEQTKSLMILDTYKDGMKLKYNCHLQSD